MIFYKVRRGVRLLSNHRIIILALIIVFFAGCSIGAVKRAQGLLPGKNIVILPIFLDRFNVQHTGTTVFSNWQYYHTVPDWDVNSYIVETAKHLIQTKGQVHLLDIDISTTQQLAIKDPRFLDAISGIGFKNEKKNKNLLRLLGEKAKADYIIVISPTGSEDVYFGTNQYIKGGYGYYQKTTFGIKRAMLYAGIRIAVMDARTGDHIASAYAFNHSSYDAPEYKEDDPQIEDKVNRDKPIILGHIKDALEQKFAELGIVATNRQ